MQIRPTTFVCTVINKNVLLAEPNHVRIANCSYIFISYLSVIEESLLGSHFSVPNA